MTRFFWIYVLAGLGAGLALQVAWYFVFSSYNRRRGAQALQRVEAACRGRARITSVRWQRGERLQASIKFPLGGLENTHVTISLRPRALPIRWLFSWWHDQRETLTLDADMEQMPRVSLQVLNHRTTYRHTPAHSEQKKHDDKRDWEFVRTAPLVLTTRECAREQSLPELNALMSARQNGFQQVEFRPVSPQFSATIELKNLADPAVTAKFLTSLRGMATGKSVQRQ